MEQVVQKLRPYILDWRAYFGLAQTPYVWRTLDGWIRRRLRALQLKQWKRGSTMIRELRALGARMENAKQVARNAGSWWRNSAGLVRITLNNAYFDRLGVPRFS